MLHEDQLDRDMSETQQERERTDHETMNLDRLVALADTDGLVRMGLEVMEAFAKVEGRVLWH